MTLATGFLAAFCACCTWTVDRSDGARQTLTLHVNLESDRSVTPTTISVAKSETAALWNAHGVEVLWSDGGAARHLNVIVAPRPGDAASEPSLLVLGHTAVDGSGRLQGPIHISFDRIESLFRFRPSSHPLLLDWELGRALGRVLAHEIGHVLLGPPTYHDREGLMRPNFFVDELRRPDRRPFQLTGDSAGRLQSHIERLVRSAGAGAPLCSP